MSQYIKLNSANQTYQELYDSLDDRSGYATEGQKAIEKLMTKLNSLPSIDDELIKYSKAFDVFSEYINFNKSKIIELDKLLYWILERKSEELDKNINESKKRIKKLKSETSNKLPK